MIWEISKYKDMDIIKTSEYNEGVDGYAFMELTEIDLKELKIKIGPRKRILNLINACHNVSSQEILLDEVNLVQLNTQNQIFNNENVQNKENILSTTENSSSPKCQKALVPFENKSKEIHRDFDIRSWIKENEKESKRNPSLINILDSGIIHPTNRQELIRICCAGLIQLNNNNLYPSHELKIELARQIITQFPKLRSTLSENGYEHFYDNKTNQGFIEYRLKTMRKHLSPSKKRKAISKELKIKKSRILKDIKQEKYLEEDIFTLKVAELALKMPNETNKDDIFRLSDETRCNRQKQIKESDQELTLSDILKMYPRFKDYKGELIHREFLAEFPDNDKFLAQFTTFYVPRILQYCSLNAPYLLLHVNDIEDNMKALILLPHLLPSPNYTKSKKKNDTEITSMKKKRHSVEYSTLCSRLTIPHKSLLIFKNAQDDLFLNECSQNNKNKNVQPYLICSKTSEERKGIYYIKADDHLIEIGSNGLQAFDILLKLHYCFDVHFSADLINFYNFITGCILQLIQPKACCVAFDVTLKNLSTNKSIHLHESSDYDDEEI